MELAKKVICIIGGSGYVGQNIAKFAAAQGMKVYCVSRRGEPEQKLKFSSQIHWIKGDAMQPEGFKDVLIESNFFIHTVGTLIDSSIIKNKKIGSEGTYEHLNRDCAISIGKFLNLQSGKKIVYLSASRSPPFIPRYLQTKEEAEEFLLSQPNIKTSILKPGFIFSYGERKWSIPLKYGIDTWSKGFGCFYDRYVPKNTFMNQVLKEFKQDTSISLNDVTLAAVVAALNPHFDGKKLYNQDMLEIRNKYDYNGRLIYK